MNVGRFLVLSKERISFAAIDFEEVCLPSEIVKDLQSAFDAGELDCLKASILPFIRANRNKLLQFIQNFQCVEGPSPLEVMIKVFILQNNMPFDLKDYMLRQTDRIEQEIGPCDCAETRRASVAEWIHQKAADHRSISMFQQVYCFERLKADILPLIEEELNYATQPA